MTTLASHPDPASSDAALLVQRDQQPQLSTYEAASGETLLLEELLQNRLSTIKEGDNVLLRLPSDGVKAVVASQTGLIQLGKFGAFPSARLLGLQYNITYEIIAGSTSTPTATPSVDLREFSRDDLAFGQAKGKKAKKAKGKEQDDDPALSKSKPAWNNVLRPLKRQAMLDAVIDDITETNELIEDTEAAKQTLMSQDEINELRAQGLSAEDLIERQIARHEQFGLKTDFSKEKWRKRKEKKFYQTIHPLAPSIPNIVDHYSTRAPSSILHLRNDTLSQLLLHANVRPGGRYLVVDDTGGLVTAAILERMGCEGRILLFTESDSPPAWGVLSVMNIGEKELECVKWVNWMEAEEDYERPLPPGEESLPQIAAAKTAARLRRHNQQVVELNQTRTELYMGNWDGLILATELSPISVLSRLAPYLAGSAAVTVYSPYLQVLAETLQFCRKDPNYLGSNISESWSRTYQVLPGRTHPMMTTSATGGYLLHAIKV
ncbi:tRNA (adenine58-N1)-methyltransferase non-catalytic subunit, partial [Tremellales sp. Uapishka_1]